MIYTGYKKKKKHLQGDCCKCLIFDVTPEGLEPSAH